MIELDCELIERYIHHQKICSENYWIFDKIVDGEHLYEETGSGKYDEIRRIYEYLKNEKIENLILNGEVIHKLFGDLVNDYRARLNIIVGAPDPYDAFVREHQGQSEIFMDMNRLVSYGKSEADCIKTLKNFTTHELTHIAIQSQISRQPQNKRDELHWMVFNEGLAHYVAFNDCILSTDWNTQEYLQRKEVATQRMSEVLREDRITDTILQEGCSGPYWSKFAAIYGMFYFGDIFNNDLGNVHSVNEVYNTHFNLMIDSNL